MNVLFYLGKVQPLRLKKIPIFRSVAKYEKKLLIQDDLWQLFKDFGFVPIVVKLVCAICMICAVYCQISM